MNENEITMTFTREEWAAISKAVGHHPIARIKEHKRLGWAEVRTFHRIADRLHSALRGQEV